MQVTPGDSGFYSCVAGNILGESVSTAHLAISPAPRPRPLALLLASLLWQESILCTKKRTVSCAEKLTKLEKIGNLSLAIELSHFESVLAFSAQKAFYFIS